MRHSFTFRRGTTLIGLLVVVAIIGVLIAVMSTALKGVKGSGPGGVAANSMTNFEDRHNLSQIFQCIAYDSALGSGAGGSGLTTPSEVAKGPKSLDTTANFWSMVISRNNVPPQMLFSKADMNMRVQEDFDYNRNAYDPMNGVYWDTSFKADLNSESNVSFAHMPLLGDRQRKNWVLGASSMFPLIGNRGPKDGIPNPQSWTCDPATGQWKGNILFGDGHIDYVQTMTPPNVSYNKGGQSVTDNIFALEDGYRGVDAILTFTQAINDSSFEMQFD